MRQILIKSILLSFALFSLGCSIRNVPAVNEFTLTGKNEGFQTSANNCKDKSIKILDPFASNKYSINDLYYVILPYEENRYIQSAWVEPVSTMLYNEILKAVRESRLFGYVSNYSSLSRGEYLLEIEINDFKQYFMPDKKRSYVVSDITFTLIKSNGLKPIAQQEVYKKIKTDSLNAIGGVEALNRAQQETIEKMIKWLDRTCQKQK